jgi:alcohol dehydrogenase YqhD (iron-dependent ADH family)
MIIKNEFNSTKIIFGLNQRAALSKLIKKKIVLVVCSKRAKKEIVKDKKLTFIQNNKIFWIDDIRANPSLTYLEKINKILKKESLII